MTDSQLVSATAHIDARPRDVFALLRSPSAHPQIDGSGTVLASRTGGPAELNLGDRFHMSMRRGIPYRMWNTVVEFETSDGGTLVTETFDWSTCRAKWLIHAMRAPKNNLGAIRATLERMQHHFQPTES